MSFLRMQNRTPPIYCEESRDFQLFCRLYDSVINNILFDTDTIPDTLNAFTIRSSFLKLLQTKLGFFTRHSFNDRTLRYTLAGFPIMLKYKGSKTSIIYAVNTFLKINNIQSPVTVTYQKTPLTLYNGYTVPDHSLVIGISASLQESSILEEIFRYILPVGTIYYFYYYSKISQLTSVLFNDNAEVVWISDNINSVLRSGFDSDSFMDNLSDQSSEKNRLIGAIDTINLLTSYFNEQGDMILTNIDDDTAINDHGINYYGPGFDLTFLGVHYDETDNFNSFIESNFDVNTFIVNKTIIVFNEKEYVYTGEDMSTNKGFIKINLLPAVDNVNDIESNNKNKYDVRYNINSSATTFPGYYMYNGDTWEPFNYPIYTLGQSTLKEKEE